MYEKIPEELRKLDQWVCAWDGSKIPMRAFERKGASSVDPASWSSFDQAAACVEAEVYDQIGFVFNDNGIVGIDIDTGFEDGLMTPLCADIIKAKLDIQNSLNKFVFKNDKIDIQKLETSLSQKLKLFNSGNAAVEINFEESKDPVFKISPMKEKNMSNNKLVS